MQSHPKTEKGNGRKNEVSLTKVTEEDMVAKLNLTCKQHGKEMKQIGQSERGLPNFYCEKGCKAEVGIGRVKKVIEDDGYGFIYTGGDDIFFHFSNLSREARPVERGDLVKFQIGYNPVSGKLQAVRIESQEGLRG